MITLFERFEVVGVLKSRQLKEPLGHEEPSGVRVFTTETNDRESGRVLAL